MIPASCHQTHRTRCHRRPQNRCRTTRTTRTTRYPLSRSSPGAVGSSWSRRCRWSPGRRAVRHRRSRAHPMTTDRRAAADPARYGSLAAGLGIVVGVLCLLARLLRARAAGVVRRRAGRAQRPGTGAARRAAGPVHRLSALAALAGDAHRHAGGRGRGGVVLAATPRRCRGRRGRGFAAGPALPLLHLDDWIALLLPAAGIAMVGYSDTMLTARSFAARKGRTSTATPSSSRSVAATLLVGLIRGLPVSSSGSRTSIGDAQGSRTQLPPAGRRGRRAHPRVRPGRAGRLPDGGAGCRGDLRRCCALSTWGSSAGSPGSGGASWASR